MKLIGVDFGRVSLLVDLVDLGTRTGLYIPEASAIVQNRYAFVNAPTLSAALQQQQMYRFEHGRLSKGDKTHAISAFEIHPHGLVAQGADTNAVEAFLEDFLAFGVEHLAIKSPTRPPNKIYLSALVVEFDKDLSNLLKKWSDLSALFNSHLKATYGIEPTVQLSTLSLQPDPQDLTPRLSALLGSFVLDRRIYEPYQHQRFHASAPLRTDDHVALLKAFEKLL